ncbi:MAG TPA: hypothetical protein PKI03_11640 [Pseudomonadota bacterium]|nr:hypothetical protein [Pseudomonadota bacterium]
MNPLQQAQAEAAHALVRQGSLRGRELLSLLLGVPAMERESFVDTLLGLPEAPPDEPRLPRGAVPYLPAGVDEILTMVSEVPLCGHDRFVDLGAGLGRVVLLAHLLTLAPAHGIEIQTQLVAAAQTCAQALQLAGVTFQCADAASVRLAGSVFFLYSPFSGSTLQQVLAELRSLAERQTVVVVTVGLELPGEAWLRRRSTALPSLTIYESECASSRT